MPTTRCMSHMVRHSIPRVIDDHLIPPDSADQSFPALQVGSEAWFAWLDEPATRSFTFHSPQGTLTARREHRRGTWYWYAYRSREGHLHKIYLGKSEELTLVRLYAAATLLSAENTTSPQPHGTLPPLHPPAATLLSSAISLPSRHLLKTKISVPPTRQNMVMRPRLMQRMNAAMRGTLTLVVAPAGWGKTTLLHALNAEARRSPWPLAWVSLDASDNNSLRFWTYVISALNTLHPGVGETPLALLYASSPPPIEAVLVPLLLASRSDPPLPLARLRAQGTLTELRAPDLRFTLEETAAFLTKVMGLPLSIEQVTALQARTEGWITGLQLAALSLQG